MDSYTRLRRLFQVLGTIVVALLFLWFVQNASAMFPAEVAPGAIITVNTTTDENNSDGDCSLREAVRSANLDLGYDNCTPGNGADTIMVPAGVYSLTVFGYNEDLAVTGDLDIREGVTIIGDGDTETVITGDRGTSGDFDDRIFEVIGGTNAPVTFRALAIRRGDLGGVRADLGTAVRLEEVAIEENNQGMTTFGTLEVISSTFGGE